MSQNEIAAILNQNVAKVVTAENLDGFEKAYLVASAVGELQRLLTKEYMKPIMELQGNRLGFKADKVYAEDVVKNCLIEAVLMGVQPVGNQFNIIAGNSYITKEGFKYLLDGIKGLEYSIIPALPRIKDGSGAVVMTIEWTINGISDKKDIDFAIKVNNFMGADAVIGKATRKARAWLYNRITGKDAPDGDTQDIEAAVVGSKINADVLVEDLQFLLDNKRNKLSPEELDNADRIIETKETASYSKLKKLLESK